MSKTEKFEVLEQELVKENEKVYGEELKQKYGKEELEQSKQALLAMTEEQYEQWKDLENEILHGLQEAVRTGVDVKGEEGKELALLHKRWITMSWNFYQEQAHRSLVMMYTEDSRFQQYYDKEEEGCAKFLQEAVLYWIK